MKHSYGRQIVALGVTAGLLLGTTPRAHADSPAVIGVAMVGGAIIGAGTAVLVSKAYQAGKDYAKSQKDDQPETTTEGGDGGETGGDNTGGGDTSGGSGSGGSGGSTERRMGAPALVWRSKGVFLSGSVGDRVSASYDDSSTNPAVTSYIDRSGEVRMEPDAKGYVNTRFRYSFQGDVLKAPADIGKFTHDESLVFELTLDSNAIQDPTQCVSLELGNMRLETKDIPGSVGYVNMSIHVFEDGVQTAVRELMVRQGSVPQRPAWAQGPGWVFAKDRVDIMNARVPLPCSPDPGVTNVKVAVAFQYSGARL